MRVRDLASIAFGHRGHGIIVGMRVYFDGAGKAEDHPIITVGGYLASDEMCEQIEDDWEQATGESVFHLADFGTDWCELGSARWCQSQQTAFLKRMRPRNYRVDRGGSLDYRRAAAQAVGVSSASR